MAKSFVMADKGKDIMGDALSAALHGGVLDICEADDTVLVSFALAANTTVNGLITLAAPGAAAATHAGTATKAYFYNAGSANLLATANAGIGVGFTVNLDNDVIALAQVVTISSCVITVPAGT